MGVSRPAEDEAEEREGVIGWQGPARPSEKDWLFCILGRCRRGVRTGRAPLSAEVRPRACQSRGL